MKCDRPDLSGIASCSYLIPSSPSHVPSYFQKWEQESNSKMAYSHIKRGIESISQNITSALTRAVFPLVTFVTN